VVQYFVATQKIELVGGEDWLTRSSGSLLLAVAAFFAAGLAAYVAIRNQREQLAHDRYLRNQDHVRDTIDAAVAMTNETVTAASLFNSKISAVEKQRESLASVVADDEATPDLEDEERMELGDLEKELSDRENTLYAAIVAMHPASVHLGMRLDVSHPIITAYDATRGAAERLYIHMIPGATENRDAAERGTDEEKAAAVRDAFGAFRLACYQWFNQ